MSASNYQRSRQILQALVQGADPETGSELPGDTVVNRVDVVRALLAAIEALDSVSARALRRAQLPESVGKSWSEGEERRLKKEFAGGESVPDIAAKHGRTVRAIEARLERLGLLRSDQRTTNNSFLGGSGAKEGQ
jgi:DNA-binding NarL/FixJ family response regulator